MPVSPDDAVQLGKGLLEVYSDAELRLLDLIGQAVVKGIDTPTWREQQLIAVQRLRAQTAVLLGNLEQAGTAAAEAAALAGYNRGAAVAGVDLARLGGDTAAGSFGGVDTRAVIALTAAAGEQLRDTGLVIRSQQEAIYRDVVQQTAGRILTTGMTRRDASWDALQTWADKGVTGFVDRAGKSWSMTSYAEMIGRTAASQAIMQGHRDRLVDAGNDLVMISDAPEECERCRPWEGRVLSLTGRTPSATYTAPDGTRYTVAGTLSLATAAGLFHPNCRHRTVAYFPGITQPLTDTADPVGDQLRQQQRGKERRVRELKRRVQGAETVAGKNSPQAKAARAKLSASQADFKAWRDEHGRKNLSYRTSIATPTPRPKTPPAAPKAPTPPPGPRQLTGSFAPKPPPATVKTQLTGSFAPKPAPIVKTQLSGSFAPKPPEKRQLTGSFAPKAPAKPAASSSTPKLTLADFKVAAKHPPKPPAVPVQAPPAIVPKPKAPAKATPKAKPTPVAKPISKPKPAPKISDNRRRFESAEDGQTWASDHWPGAEHYPESQRKAVRTYTDEDYETINGKLRKTEGREGGIRALDAAINKAPRVPEDVVVARSTSARQFGLPANADLSSLVGRDFVDHGYLSTSVDTHGYNQQAPVHMNLSVPKGHKAIYVSGRPGESYRTTLSVQGSSEKELVLARGSQYRITGVRKVGKTWVVDADIIGGR